MNNGYLKYGLIALLLVLIQVLLLNHLKFQGYIDPIIYILIIFIYPFNKNKARILLFSFFLGLTVDIFSDSGGSHTAAILFIAYVRLFFIRLVQNNIEFDYLLFHIKKLNILQIITYVFSLTFIHHLILFYLEYYTLKGFSFILLKVLYTSIFSSILLSLSIALFVKNDTLENER